MKKVFPILIFILFTMNGYSQYIKWGKPFELETPLFSNFKIQDGFYLGNISGFDYYVLYNLTKSLAITTKIDFTIIKAKNNETLSITELSNKGYNYISIQILEDQIAIFYYDDSNEESYIIKVDLYNPINLSFVKSSILYKYKPVRDSSELIQFAKNQNNSLFSILTTAVNPEDNRFSFLVKTFNFQFEEQGETYFGMDLHGDNYIKDFTLQNDGYAFVTISEFKKENFKYFNDKLHFIKCKDGDAELIVFQNENKNIPCDYQIIVTRSNKEKLILTENDTIKIFDLSFVGQSYTEQKSVLLTHGNWIIDKTLILDNGNIFIALTNSNSKQLFYNYDPNKTEYYLSFNFLSFTPDLKELNYHAKVGRYYCAKELYIFPYEKVSRVPLYVQKNNSVIVYYNTSMSYSNRNVDKDSENLVSNDIEIPDYLIYQKTIIYNNGGIENSFITDSMWEKTGIYSSFCHANSDNTVTAIKVYNKNFTIGTVPK